MRTILQTWLLTLVTLTLTGCEHVAQPDVVSAYAPAPARVADISAELRLPDLIPREHLLGNPERFRGRLSPDGRYISYLAPVNGVMNVMVAPIDSPDDARAVTAETRRSLTTYFWTYQDHQLVYLQDSDGDENDHIFRVDVRSKERRDLTPYDGVAARIDKISALQPDSILVAINDRDKSWHDLYRVELATSNRHLVQRNEQFESFLADGNYRVVLASKPNPTGGYDWLRPVTGARIAWQPFLSFALEDALTSMPVGVTSDGKNLYLLDSSKRDTAALFEINFASGERRLLAEDARADIGTVMSHPVSGKALAYSVNYLTTQWHALTPEMAPVIAAMHNQVGGEIGIPGMTRDGRQWLLYADAPQQPLRYLVLDSQARQARVLFDTLPALSGATLAAMYPVSIPARDGRQLVSYLTLPPGSDQLRAGTPLQPLPMVLLVHGGPWGRDQYGFNNEHQWLANRGYAVLSVNFRASTGFGKAFVNAGNKEWGRAMHDDLLDAVAWANTNAIADPAHVAIMGGSFGGYAALSGLTFSPKTFACAVDLFGPSNLETLLATIPPYWASFYEQFTHRVGDPRTDDGRKLLQERSPLHHVGHIERPLLIGQGSTDPRVKQAESDQIVEAMSARGIPVTYLLYPDEGHGFVRAENRVAFNAAVEKFLSQHLGGRAERYGDDFDRSSTVVMHGGQYIGGLSQAVASARTLQALGELPATAAGQKSKAPAKEEEP